MFLKKREISILQLFLNDSSENTIKELSDKYKVSERSIRYDIDSLNYFLKEYGIKIEKEGKSKLKLLITKKQREELLRGLDELDISNIYLEDEEKKFYIIIRLMNSDSAVTIATLADELCISRTSLNNIMKDVYEWFDKKGLKVIKKTNKGIKLEYDENKWRKVMIQLLNSKSSRGYFYSILNKPCINTSKDFLNPINYILPIFSKSLFDEEFLINLIDSISEIENKLSTKFTDSSYMGLLIHLAVAIKRLRQNKRIEMSADELEAIKTNSEYKLSEEFVLTLEEKFNVKIPEEEIAYITLHLLGAKRKADYNDKNIDLKQTALEVIAEVEKILPIIINPIYINELANDLTLHLEPSIIRIKNDLQIANPILDTITKKYENIFNATKKACEIIKAKYELKKFPDEEIAFITMHIGAAIEKSSKIKKRNIKALIMCATGVGTARLLSTRLQVEFPEIEIVGEISLMELGRGKLPEADIIISTLDVDTVYRIPIIKVSPLLSETDITKIEKTLNIKRLLIDQNFIEDTHILIEEIMEVVKKSSVVINESDLKNNIYKILTDTRNRKENLPMLSDLIAPERIKIIDEVDSWKDAVKIAGELLVETKCAKDCYVDAMINTVEELGPYIVLTDGIAMPHARPEDGALNVAMSLVILKNPVNFGSEKHDPVSAVFGLCATDNHTHLQALSDMGKFATTQERFEALKTCKDENEIYKCIKETCEKGE